MKNIFDEVKLNNLELKNRLVRSATWEGIANADGGIDERAFAIYNELAKGGAGLIISGFTSVSQDDVYFDGMMRLSDDFLIPQYGKLPGIAHKNNCKMIAQLALGGYYRGKRLVETDMMTPDDIARVVNWFSDAAVRAEKAGFDGVQIHCAHFFFLSRFVSPLHNHRDDEYGGSTAGRSRILVEILQRIRESSPRLHVSIKINSSDFCAGGLEEKESLTICEILSDNGIDSIEVSGNGTSVAGVKPYAGEGYFVDFASRLSNTVKTPIIVVGGLRSREYMEDILNDTNICLLSLSRPLICEPDLPNKLKSGESDMSECVSCNACYSSFEHRCVRKHRGLGK